MGSNKVVAVFLAGGKGTRLWPLSTTEKPKPFISINKNQTLLDSVISSVQPYININDTYIVLDKEYYELLLSTNPDFPKKNIILEPVGKNTAAAAGLATIKISKQFGPDTVCVVLAVDYIITGHHERFLEALQLAAEVAMEHNVLVDVGVIPVRPDTKYGYLHVKERMVLGDNEFLKVYENAKFTEKPSLEETLRYLETGEYLWNTAIFAWKCSTFLEAILRSMPDLYSLLMDTQRYLDTENELQELENLYKQISNPISIDYGIMDRASNITAIAANFGWTEVGSWVSLETLIDVDHQGNLIVADHNGIDTENCIIYSDSEIRIFTLGVSDLIIVQAHGRILVCHKDKLGQLDKLANLDK